MTVERFETETIARRFAAKWSAKHGLTMYVIESAHKEDPSAGRFCADTDGSLRSWERHCATYENGKRVE